MNLKEIYNKEFILDLAENLSKFYPKFQKEYFIKQIFDKNWQNYALKERVSHISDIINQNLSENYDQNIKILQKTIQNVQKFQYSSLSLIIFSDFVEKFGIDDFKTSINALKFFTPFGSAEFAIRKFLLRYEKQTLEEILKFSLDQNYHIRRLASESIRPRLPWGISLKKYQKDPNIILPILENLKNDSSEYVRRSVANNLNDISKDNPEITLKIAKRWQKQGCNNKMIAHSLRTLLKKGNKIALKLMGYDDINTQIIDFNCQKEVKVGKNLEFSFILENINNNNIRIEYAISFLLKNGKFYRKIFQIKQGEFQKGNFSFIKKHSFKRITTRKYYSGIHKIAIILNGVEVKQDQFLLIF